MSAILAPVLPVNYVHASSRNDFFSSEVEDRALVNFEKREQPPVGVPGDSCKINLFFGFFFDGTRNNYVLAEKSKEHSNVARLYDIFQDKACWAYCLRRLNGKRKQQTSPISSACMFPV